MTFAISVSFEIEKKNVAIFIMNLYFHRHLRSTLELKYNYYENKAIVFVGYNIRNKNIANNNIKIYLRLNVYFWAFQL